MLHTEVAGDFDSGLLVKRLQAPAANDIRLKAVERTE